MNGVELRQASRSATKGVLKVKKIVLFAITLVFTSSALAQNSDPAHECVWSKNSEQTSNTCDRVANDTSFSETDRAIARVRLAQIRVSQNKFDQAIAELSAAISLNPSFVYAINGRGLLLLEKGDWSAAIADFNAVIQLSPKYASPYNWRAWAYFNLGNLSEGLADANRALELNPKLAEAYDTRAHVWEAMAAKSGDDSHRDKAIIDYLQALKLKPGLQESLDGLKRLHW